MMFFEVFCDVHNERPDLDLAVLLWRWWILRSCCREFVRRDMPFTMNSRL